MCEHVNDPGGREGAMPVLERNAQGVPTVWCDPCMVPLITALRAGGFDTIASCCGHGKVPGTVLFRDGSALVLHPDQDSLDRAWPPTVTEARAQALEAAADAWNRLDSDAWRRLHATPDRWLRDRAAAIREGADQ